MSTGQPKVSCNGRDYAWPDRPLVVICLGGTGPAYLERALASGAMPALAGMLARGSDLRAEGVIPSFTEPNNVSIITGAAPAVHGISGSHFLDHDSGEALLLNEPRYLRGATIPAAFEAAGARVAVITAREALARLLEHGLHPGAHGSVGFSAERADRATLEENGVEAVLDLVGRALPDLASADLSAFVLAAGVCLMEHIHPDLTYLSTADHVQREHAPGSAEADALYRTLDGYLARLDELGATLAVTADHGVSPKYDATGKPNIIHLQAWMDQWLGDGRARVVLPMADPYVTHHGALGSFATIYLATGVERAALLARLGDAEGVALALDREDACHRFELPPDRIGDLVVVAGAETVFGSLPGRHDLSALAGPLRSCGGLSEQLVPLLLNRPVAVDPRRRLRSFDVFDLALNAVSARVSRAAATPPSSAPPGTAPPTASSRKG